MTYKQNMPTLNLYIDNKTKDQLKELADKENRSISKQVKHMLEYYIEHHE